MQLSGNGKVTEVDDFSDFVVDEEDLQVLQEAKAMATARCRAPAGPEENSHLAEDDQPAAGPAKKGEWGWRVSALTVCGASGDEVSTQ